MPRTVLQANRPKIASRSAVALLVLPLLQAGCGDGMDMGGARSDGAAPCARLRVRRIPPGASVVLIVNDTMRRDSLGVHGGSARTPRFDAFARENLLFTQALAPAPWTKPSIASLFTSLYPSQHQVASDPSFPGRAGTEYAETMPVDVLAEDFLTLAEILRQAGLRTAAFVGNPWLREQHGFAQGFETYVNTSSGWKTSGEDVVRAALDWLARRTPGEPFFLYVHTIDSHRPYGQLTPEEADQLPEPGPDDARLLGDEGEQLVRALKRTDGQPLVAPSQPASRAAVERAYERGLEDFDRVLGLLLDGLRANEAWERTAVLVTSDHGEALFARGYGNHGGGLYDDELAIPLAARLPGIEPATGEIDCTVSLVDVVPSLCDYLGLRAPPSSVGWSFLGDSTDTRGGERFVVSEGTTLHASHRAIRGRDFKLIFEPTGGRDQRGRPYALFDVARDPEERTDLLAGAPAPDVTEVFEQLKQALPRTVPAYAAPDKTYAPMDEEQLQQLRALGYVDD